MTTKQIAGAWTTERLVTVLSNAMARAALKGQAQPVAELALARLTGTK